MGAQGLDFQVVPVEFTGGLDTRTNPKLRLPGKWDLLLNCTHSKDGTPAKRDGVRALVPGVNGHGLATFDEELLAIKGTTIYTALLNPSVDAVAVSGQLPCLHVKKKEVVRGANARDQVDAAVGLNLEVYVWREHSLTGGSTIGVYVCAFDTSTRALALKPTLLSATGNAPRVVNVGDAFMVFWSQGAGPGRTIHAAVYAPLLGVGPATSLGITTNGSVFEGYDAVGFGFDAIINFVYTGAISYVFDDGVTSVRCSQVTYSEITLIPAVMSTVNLFTEAQAPYATIRGLGMSVVGGLAGAGAFAGTFISSIGGAPAMSGTAGNAVTANWIPAVATQIDAVAPYTTVLATPPTHVAATRYPVAGIASCRVFVDAYSDNGLTLGVRSLRSYSVTIVGAGLPLVPFGAVTVLNSNTSSYVTQPQGPFIAGCPFVIGKPPAGLISSTPETIALPVYMAAATSDGIVQSGLFLVDGITGAVLGKALYGQLASYGYGAQVPSSPPIGNPTTERTGKTTFVVPALELGRLELLDDTNVTPTGVAAIMVSPNLPMGSADAEAWAPRRVQHGRATFIANGMLSAYDGVASTEADFNMFPEGLVVTQVPAGGTWAAGTYEFAQIYEWVDGQGQRHQSAPSPPVRLVVNANDLLNFTTPTLQLTQRSNLKHVVFATQPNGTTLNRLGTALAPVEIENNKALAVSITGVAAGPPSSNELLYSQPFVADTTLPNDAPGPCSIVAVHQNRLWVDLTDRDGAFRYSQGLLSGVGIQFNETLGGQLPVSSGAIMGFASMDETLVILTERKLFRITGTGPTPSGGYNGYSDPVEIPSDVGCSSAASVLSIPEGVMFRATKGWHVIGRDLSVRYVGAPIKKWDSDTITSVVLMEDRQEIRVSSRSTTDTAFAGAIQFCYSYVSDTWSVFQVTSLTRAVAPVFVNTLQVWDAVWWPTTGRYVSIGYYDGINNDTPGVYLDWVGNNASGVGIGMSARSSFLHLAALEGFQRVRWLYLTASAPTAPATSLSIRVDYDDLYSALNPPGAPGSYLTTGTVLTAVPFANPATVDVRHKFRRQKCKSVAITINETPVSPGAPGLTGFQAMALQIGVRRGVNRLPPTHVVG